MLVIDWCTCACFPIRTEDHIVRARAERLSMGVDATVGTSCVILSTFINVTTRVTVISKTSTLQATTGTLVRTKHVPTLILTRSMPIPQQALVHVLAAFPIRSQPVPVITEALKRTEHVGASLIATSVVVVTFVDVWEANYQHLR